MYYILEVLCLILNFIILYIYVYWYVILKKIIKIFNV